LPLINEKGQNYLFEISEKYEIAQQKLSEYDNKFKEISKILSDELNNKISIFSYSVWIKQSFN
jgi:hypothetical protein